MVKIAIISDTHLGYPRFSEDAYNQAKSALIDANEKADLILLAGDVFDTRIPKFETIEQLIGILREMKVPVIAIHGNHERRSRDMINALQLLQSGGLITYLHNEGRIIEVNGEKINIIGLGNVPSGYEMVAIESSIKKNPRIEGVLNIFLIHQDIKGISFGESDLSIEDIDKIPYELVVNGHVHKKLLDSGKLIIPGSTVVTQLKEGETEQRGYVIYDTTSKKSEFFEIPCRKFVLKVLEFNNSGISEVRERIEKELAGIDENTIIKIVLKGTLKEGLESGDLSLSYRRNGVYLENKLNVLSLKEKIEKIKELKENKLSVREVATKALEEKTKGKIDFNAKEFFEKISEGVEEGLEYLGVYTTN